MPRHAFSGARPAHLSRHAVCLDRSPGHVWTAPRMQEKNREFRQAVRLRSCVRPVDAAHMSAGPDGFRDPTPNKPAASKAIDRDGFSGSSVRPIVISFSSHILASMSSAGITSPPTLVGPRHASHLVHRPNSRGAWLNHGRSRAVVQSPATRSGRVRKSPATLPRSRCLPGSPAGSPARPHISLARP